MVGAHVRLSMSEITDSSSAACASRKLAEQALQAVLKIYYGVNYLNATGANDIDILLCVDKQLINRYKVLTGTAHAAPFCHSESLSKLNGPC